MAAMALPAEGRRDPAEPHAPPGPAPSAPGPAPAVTLGGRGARNRVLLPSAGGRGRAAPRPYWLGSHRGLRGAPARAGRRQRGGECGQGGRMRIGASGGCGRVRSAPALERVGARRRPPGAVPAARPPLLGSAGGSDPVLPGGAGRGTDPSLCATCSSGSCCGRAERGVGDPSPG